MTELAVGTSAPVAVQPLDVGLVRTMARVNLLPPGIGQRRRLRRLQAVLAAAVCCSAVAVGAAHFAAAGQEHAAAAELATAQSKSLRLAAGQRAYADVPRVYAALDQARALLSTAMGSEVLWSRVLDDLSTHAPAGVWLKSAQLAPNSDTSVVATGTAGAADTSAPIGLMTVTGTARSHDAVASWLDAMSGTPGFADPYITASSTSGGSSATPITFTASVSLTSDIRSNRYTATEPETTR